MGEGTGTPTDDSDRAELLERLGHAFKDPTLLDTALTHRSFAYEHSVDKTNERLELLGDAVLSLVVTDIIYRLFPDYVEGDLAKLRASLVSTPALAGVADELCLGDAVRLGRGEELTGGRTKPSILADTLEAVLGAVYLDGGVRGAQRAIKRLFGPRIKAAIGQEVPKDPKTRLQEWVTRIHGDLPRYRVAGEGPDHEKRFRAEVYVNEVLYGNGRGRSKKEAEQAAAAEALLRLEGEAVDEVIEHA